MDSFRSFLDGPPPPGGNIFTELDHSELPDGERGILIKPSSDSTTVTYEGNNLDIESTRRFIERLTGLNAQNVEAMTPEDLVQKLNSLRTNFKEHGPEHLSATRRKTEEAASRQVQTIVQEKGGAIPTKEGITTSQSPESVDDLHQQAGGGAASRKIEAAHPLNVDPLDRKNIQKNAIKNAAAPLLEGISRGPDKLRILRAVKSLDLDKGKEERDAIIQEALPFLKNESALERAEIVRTIASLPPGQRSAIIQAATPFLNDLNLTEQIFIIRTVASFAASQRDAILQVVAPFLMNKRGIFFQKNHIAQIIKKICSFTEPEKAAYLMAADSLLGGITDIYAKASLLGAVVSLPIEQRDAILEAARPLLDDSTDGLSKARIIEAVGALHPDQRRDILEAARPLQRNSADGILKMYMIQAVGSLRPDQRHDILEAAAPLLENITREIDRARTIEVVGRTIGDLPSAQQKAIVEAAIPLLQDTMDPLSMERVLSVVASVPPEQRNVFLRATILFLEVARNDQEKANIICAMGALPPGHRNAILQTTPPFLMEITEAQILQDLLQSMISLPPEDWDTTFDAAASFLGRTTNDEDKLLIFKTMAHLSPADRPAILEAATAFLEGITNIPEVDSIIHSVASLTPEQRVAVRTTATQLREITGGYRKAAVILVWGSLSEEADVATMPTLIAQINPLFDNLAATDHSHLYSFLQSIPKEKRAFVIAAAPAFVTNARSGSELAILSRFLSSLKEREVAAFEAATPLLNGVTAEIDMKKIISIVASLPAEHRDAIFAAAAPLLENIRNGLQRALIIEAVGALPAEEQERNAILEAVTFLTSYSQGGMDEKVNLIHAIGSLKGQREAILTVAVPLLDEMIPPLQPNAQADLIRVVASLPEEQRAALINKVIAIPIEASVNRDYAICVLQLLGKIHLANDSEKEELVAFEKMMPSLIRKRVHLRLLGSLPPSDLLAAAELLLDYPDLREFSDILEEIDGLKERMIAFHRNIIEHSSNKALTLESANAILDNFDALALSDDDEIFTLATTCRSDILLEQGDKKDPYNLHGKLLRNSKRDCLSFQEVGGIRISTTALAQYAPSTITVGELRASLGSLPIYRDMTTLFENLLEKQISNQSLKAPIESDFIKNLFAKIEGPDNTKLPPDAIQLAIVLRHILSLDDQAPNERELSLRETIFLNFLNSIQDCETGKKDSIEKFYESLLREGATTINRNTNTVAGGGAAAGPVVISQEKFPPLDQLVRLALKEHFTDDLVREICNMEPREKVPQGVHQTRFLLNALGPRIGLKGESLHFDRHAQVLLQPLIDLLDDEAKMQHAVEALGRRFTPEVLTKKLSDHLKILFSAYLNSTPFWEGFDEEILPLRQELKAIPDRTSTRAEEIQTAIKELEEKKETYKEAINESEQRLKSFGWDPHDLGEASELMGDPKQMEALASREARAILQKQGYLA